MRPAKEYPDPGTRYCESPECGEMLVRRKDERIDKWIARRFCSRTCVNRANAYHGWQERKKRQANYPCGCGRPRSRTRRGYLRDTCGALDCVEAARKGLIEEIPWPEMTGEDTANYSPYNLPFPQRPLVRLPPPEQFFSITGSSMGWVTGGEEG